MKFQSRIAAAAAAALAALAAPASANPKVVKAPAVSQPVEITATYKISLNSFNLGDLQFNSRAQNGAYTANSEVTLSALLGAFKWHAVTRSSGTYAGASHQPQGYSFDFDGTRSGSIKMGYTGADVTSLAVLPQVVTVLDAVPIQRQHLSNALDPLSAILAMTRTEGDNPCAKKLSIFDGKQRFDLAFSFRRQESLGVAANGEEVMGIVCKVKYTPVAGYRDTSETRSLAQNNNIEIAFRRLPALGLSVPHRVTIPTLAGDAVIEADRINIETGSRGEVALVD